MDTSTTATFYSFKWLWKDLPKGTKGGNLTKHEIDMVSKILYLYLFQVTIQHKVPWVLHFSGKEKQLEHNTTQFLFILP